MVAPGLVMAAAAGASLTTAPHSGRARAAAPVHRTVKLATAPRGALQRVLASGATYQAEWQVYQAECDYYNLHAKRTLQIMQKLSKNFKHEWELYVEEARAAAVVGAIGRSVVQTADPSAIVGDLFDDAMRPGGYHPVHVGERFKDGQYTVLYKLGQGHYATVWMVQDALTGQQAAMKVVRSAPEYTQAARNEVSMLTRIRDSDPEDAKHCVRMLDHFMHTGPHGTHVCEVFEAMGDDLLKLLRVYSFRGIPTVVVRHLVRQTLVALDYLHSQCQITHTDLKPENVMLTEPIKPRGPKSFGNQKEIDLPGLEPRLLSMGCKIVDFGCACPTDKPYSEYVQTRQYRAPEVILGAGYGDSADMWSLACMVFELVTGDLMFHPEAAEGITQDDDHLAQMMELLDAIPVGIATGGTKANQFFTPEGQWANELRPLEHTPLCTLLQDKHSMAAEEAEELADFLLPMLRWDPSQRSSASDLLKHPWLGGEVAPAEEARSTFVSNILELDSRISKRGAWESGAMRM